jgi:Cu/Ag efflux protein CusF
MRGSVTATVAMLAGLVMLGTVVAQAQVQPSSPRPAPPAATTPEVIKDKHVEGTVSKVDPLGRTVGVSTGLFGLLGATVQVADDTQILVQGQPSKLTDIQQGDKVRASYEVRDGKNLARSIEVTQKKAQQRSSRANPPTQ